MDALSFGSVVKAQIAISSPRTSWSTGHPTVGSMRFSTPLDPGGVAAAYFLLLSCFVELISLLSFS